MKEYIRCPSCGSKVERFKNPIPTVDVIIETVDGIVLIERKNPPFGWAIPGGYVEYGETVEVTAVREAKEETSLDITDVRLFGVYSHPDRDPRSHTITTVFTAKFSGKPGAADDAKRVGIFKKDDLPNKLAFDHSMILKDYFRRKESIRT
ncbi:MAG: NUDIX hydrolase [bacterium]